MVHYVHSMYNNMYLKWGEPSIVAYGLCMCAQVLRRSFNIRTFFFHLQLYSATGDSQLQLASQLMIFTKTALHL